MPRRRVLVFLICDAEQVWSRTRRGTSSESGFTGFYDFQDKISWEGNFLLHYYVAIAKPGKGLSVSLILTLHQEEFL
jgi:hypothetical protein